MSDVVIKAEALGKKYIIGHQAENGSYVALRDVLVQNARGLWHKTRDLAQGKPLVLGNSLEEIWALKDVSFEIHRGEAMGIIGRNGAGKSTLLKVLSRITEPSAGRVTIKGRVASLLEVGTGFHPELTGRENIYLNGAILGMARTEIKHKFDEIVAFAEIEQFLDTPVKRYSSGMYVRLAFAVAAHLEPEILLVDEVLAVGDIGFQKKCLSKMDEVAKGGRTVLFVSHNMGLIAELCDRCICISNGRLTSDGDSRSIIAAYLALDTYEGEVDLRDWSADRTGGGPMRVLRLVSRNVKGMPCSAFTYGDPMIFDMDISGRAGTECIIGVSIRDSRGIIIIHQHNTDDRASVVLTDNVTRVQVRLAHNLLNDGEYYVTVWLGDAMNVLHDRVGNCLRLVVNSAVSGSVKSQGCVRVPAIWEVF